MKLEDIKLIKGENKQKVLRVFMEPEFWERNGEMKGL